MDLELTGNVAPVSDNRMRRQEKPVGYLPISHSLDYTDYNLFLPRTEALLLFVRAIGIFLFNNDKPLNLLLNQVLLIVQAYLLNQNSTMQQKMSQELMTQLQISRNLLQTTNERLTKSEISLTEAENLLKKNNEYLTTLKQQINNLQRQKKLNLIKGLAIGFVTGYIVFK